MALLVNETWSWQNRSTGLMFTEKSKGSDERYPVEPAGSHTIINVLRVEEAEIGPA